MNETEEKLDADRYYGVARNYKEKTHRRTGLLANAAKYEDVEDIMFIHNSIEELPDKRYGIKTTYYRDVKTETEAILEISDLQPPEFKMCPLHLILKVLMHIDYGVWKSFDIETAPPEHIASCIETGDEYYKTTDEECPFCFGKGKIGGGVLQYSGPGENITTTCPRCHGTGRKGR